MGTQRLHVDSSVGMRLPMNVIRPRALLPVLAVLVALTARRAQGWEHLSFSEAQSREEWLLAHCVNQAAKAAGATIRYQDPGGAWQDGSKLVDGDMESDWRVKSFPARAEVVFPEPRLISAVVWWRFPFSRGTDVYSPGKLSLESSADGTAWTPLVKDFTNPWSASYVHRFAPVRVKAVAVVVEAPLKKEYPMTILGEIGVYHFEDSTPGNSGEDPAWFGDSYGFRARIDDPGEPREGAAICRRWVDFTALVGSRAGQVPDPSSVAIVEARSVDGRVEQRECSSAFLPDARFDAKKEAVGTVAWWMSPGLPGKRVGWVYFSAVGQGTRPVVPSSPGNAAIKIGMDAAKQETTVSTAEPTQQLLVVNDLGKSLVATGESQVRLTDLDPLRRYCAVAKSKDKSEAVWFGPELPQPISAKVSLPFYNYRRGDSIPCTLELKNQSKQPFTGELTAALMGGDIEVGRKVVPVTLQASAQEKLEVTFPTSQRATGSYRLEFRVSSVEGLAGASSAALMIIPPVMPALPLGIYGLPSHTRMQVIRYLSEAKRRNITLDNGHYGRNNRDYYYDMAAAYGVEIAPCANETLWPYGGRLPGTQAVLQAANGATGNWPCFRDPVTREWGKANYLRLLADLSRFPSFGNRVGFHDDVCLNPVNDKGKTCLTCYCALCTAEFEKQTGRKPPVEADVKWENPIVPDDDLWLRWNVFRVRDCYADYTKFLTDAAVQVAPEAKLGSFLVKNLNPVAGLYSYYTQAPCGAASCYDYPRAGLMDTDAFFMRESALPGSRQKETWMLNWIGGVSGESWNGTASPGEIRCQFWNMLAAGNHLISFFYYGQPGTKSCIEGSDALDEVTRVGGVAKQVGPLLRVARPVPHKVAVLCSFTEYFGSLLKGLDEWWNVRASLRNAFFATLDENLPAGLIAEEEVVKGDAAGYKVIIVPNIRYLSRSAVSRLEEFVGKGGVVLMNANSAVPITGAQKLATSKDLAVAAKKVVDPIPLDPGEPLVTVREFAAPGLKLYVFVNQNTGQDRTKNRYSGARDMPVSPRVLDKDAAYYDLLAGKRLNPSPEGALSLTVPAAGGAMVAAYAAPVGSLRVEAHAAVTAGQDAAISVTVLTEAGEASKGTHLVEVTVTHPRGRSDEYSQRVVVPGGRYTLSIPVALNDPPGKWTVAVRECASSVRADASFDVAPEAGGFPDQQ
jgi:hypothetical protein